MGIRKSYSAPAKSNEPTTFTGKYSLKNRAGLDDKGKEAFVIPLDMMAGYVEIPYHTLKKCADGTGFRNSQFGAKIACHKFDKSTGEVVDQLPLCCRLAQMEKDRIPDKAKSGDRAISFTARRNVIPVLVLSTTETDSSRKPTIKKVSVKNGVDFSYIDMSSSAYEEFMKNAQEVMENEGDLDNPEDFSEEEIAQKVAEYLQNSIIKITNVPARNSSIPYEKKYTVIPMKNVQVAKESGELKYLNILTKMVNSGYSNEQLGKLFEKSPFFQTINNQVIDFLDLFNAEVDTIATDWTDSELEDYYNTYLEKQGVVNTYKSKSAPVQEEVVFTAPKATPKAASAPVAEDEEFGDLEDAVYAAATTATAVMEKSEDEFDGFNAEDLEESSILNDSDFDNDDFNLEDGDEI